MKFQVQVKSGLTIISFKFSSLKLEEPENFKSGQVWKVTNLTWLEIKIIKTWPNLLMIFGRVWPYCGIQSDIPLLLMKFFNALKCIPPTSVESERVFSITGQFATKLRTKLDDDTLSSLVFLKAFIRMRPQTK